MKPRLHLIHGIITLVFLCAVFSPLPHAVFAKDDDKTKCRLQFNLKGWSAFYKTSKGSGVITCDNGQSSKVSIKTHGGGVTFGTSKIINGHGSFSKVEDIKNLYGGYAESEAHAGASGTAGAKAMWKGDVGLSLSGTGKGWNLGFSFGEFRITPARK